jgi:hypothetical protein
VSGRRAKALRRAAGNPVKPAKTPTPLLERSYIQAPVGYDPVEREYRYRSGKQVRRFLAARGVDVEALAAELEAYAAERAALEDEEA